MGGGVAATAEAALERVALEGTEAGWDLERAAVVVEAGVGLVEMEIAVMGKGADGEERGVGDEGLGEGGGGREVGERVGTAWVVAVRVGRETGEGGVARELEEDEESEVGVERGMVGKAGRGMEGWVMVMVGLGGRGVGVGVGEGGRDLDLVEVGGVVLGTGWGLDLEVPGWVVVGWLGAGWWGEEVEMRACYSRR